MKLPIKNFCNSINRILVTGGSGFIGTNIISDMLGNSDNVILNIDISKPKIEKQEAVWKNLDIRNKSELKNVVLEFKPDIVLHLAARTDLRGTTLEEYSSNTIGTENLVEVLREIGFKGRAVFTSSMYVCEPGYSPENFEDYKPHTVYGESKVMSEKIIKSIPKEYTWMITRPTSIWGPWFGEPYSDFFKIVLSGRYFHLGNRSCNKTYGYIDNTIVQIYALLNAGSEMVCGKVFYLGDWPAYNIGEWANEIADTVPYKIKTFPFGFFKVLAYFGDFCKYFGLKFPMTSFRLKNMTTNNVHDLAPIKALVSELPFSRMQATAKTVNWMIGHS